MKKAIFILILVAILAGSTGFIYAKTVKTESKPGKPCKFFIYNSHPNEKYSCGESIVGFSKILNENLVKNGIDSTYIENDSQKFPQSYAESRKLLMEKVNDFSNANLIDIHVCYDKNKCKDEIQIYIGKGNPNYNKNQKYAQKFIDVIKSIDDKIPAKVIVEEKTVYNQDLSDKSMLIIVGNTDMKKEILDKISDILAQSIKKI